MKNIHIVEHPLIKKDLTILRDKTTQSEIFRSALQRISVLLASEISKNISLEQIEVETPLEKTIGHKLKRQIVLVPVLRAGLGMVNGFLELIPDSKVGHIGLQRNEETLEPIEYYFKTPSELEKSDVILLDPMLATGGSASGAITYLKNRGAQTIYFACIVAAPKGVQRINSDHPEVKIYSASLDRELNNKGYILPGLGDAGDRTFGTL
ncbi:MAG: uracil phosphoribosyltransferase [Ignavibacterium album]|jgi:uracil phosphoribosyltransferase|uniref:uracil phosphoribosyltransferase n=1 Tax=Ignavibacterium album TaxID=591197 RepID=UPI0026EE0523|nr:uracil phosphoribosyltransferase [Ignavibacterium album]MCX8104291.1 uracil phosphoribosyltransferase [Ignavibacterium album]